MGKFVKKGKITGDVAVMEVPQSVLGVRTRARTLALQQNSEFRYLQLRNRRLEKPQFPPPQSPTPRKPEKHEKSSHSSKQSTRSGSNQSQGRRPAASRLRAQSANSVPPERASFGRPKAGEVELEFEAEEVDGLGVEASFGENNLEPDGTGRSTRESTPCSLIRNVGSIGTPGSAVRSTISGAVNQRRVHEPVQRSMPSTREMDDFFANGGSQQQKQFMDKYNFDIFNDLPLPGRFEWVRVDP